MYLNDLDFNIPAQNNINVPYYGVLNTIILSSSVLEFFVNRKQKFKTHRIYPHYFLFNKLISI